MNLNEDDHIYKDLSELQKSIGDDNAVISFAVRADGDTHQRTGTADHRYGE